MKTLRPLLLITLSLVVHAVTPPIPQSPILNLPRSLAVVPETMRVLVSWPYPPEENSSDLVFKLYSTTNIASPTWVNVTNVPGPATNVILTTGTEVRFYTLGTYSKWHDKEVPSNATAQTLPTPKVTTLGIQRAP
jgi:hypothetical protein